MTDAITHRGPDAEGHYWDFYANRYIGLGHRRLSILDLSDNGRQPMLSEDSEVSIIYNGEIYNHKQIRLQLEALDYTFYSHCDTEVLLNAYMQWGYDCFTKCNGMFACAIYDKRNERLILARDRIGEKPLYYRLAADNLYFASELKSLRQIPDLEWKIDKKALETYMWKMYVPAPYTIYDDTYKLEPGTLLEYDLKTGNINLQNYWNAKSFVDGSSHNIFKELSDEEQIDYLYYNLSKSVREKLIADVPVGVFLSSGYDSTLIAALAAQENAQTISTFSIGFEEQEYNEANEAKQIAKVLGTNHHEMYCSINEAYKLINEIPYAYSEPFADNSQIPMLMLSKFAKEYVSVALSGDGGDELFCGYPSEVQLLAYKKYSSVAKIMDSISTPKTGNRYSYLYWKWNKACNMRDNYHLLQMDYYTALPIIARMIRWDSFYIKKDTKVSNLYSEPFEDSDISIIEKSLYQGIAIGLPDDMFTKVDRATMWYSLESRAPFMDVDVLEQALQMPLELKYKDGVLKYPIKELVYRFVPKDMMERPKKGFGVPINRWLHEGLEKSILKYVQTEYVKKQGIFDELEITRFYNHFINKPTPILDRLMWTYYMFQLWYEVDCV